MSNVPDCSCPACSEACSHKPGWFMPGEAEVAAAHAGLTLEQFFREYLGVDWWEGEEDTFILAPATTAMAPGAEYPGDPRGRCIFFREGKCTIHSVKPFECRQYIHSEDRQATRFRHKTVADAWKIHQDQIRTLLGRKPEAEEFEGGIFGLLGGAW